MHRVVIAHQAATPRATLKDFDVTIIIFWALTVFLGDKAYAHAACRRCERAGDL